MIRHGWQIGFLLVSILFTGCAKKLGWGSFPVSLYADATITGSAQKSADLADAMKFWEQKAGKNLFDFKGTWAGGVPYTGSANAISSALANVLMFAEPWPFSSNSAGQTTTFRTDTEIVGAIIMINPDTPFCPGDCSGEVGLTSERRTFTHELGHFLGLQHSSDINNVMYPVAQPGGSLTDLTIDQAAFEALL